MVLEWKLTLLLGRLRARAFWFSAVVDVVLPWLLDRILLLPVEVDRRFPSAPDADGIGMEASFLPRDDTDEEDKEEEEEEEDDDDAFAADFIARPAGDDDALAEEEDDETALLLLLLLDVAFAAAVGDVGHMLPPPPLLLLDDVCGWGGEALSISAIGWLGC